MAGKKLSKYVKERLPAKIRKVKEEHPELSHEAVVGRSIGILKGEEEKLKMSKDVRRRERKNRGS